MRISDVKTLWGLAAGRCAFPDCKIELTFIGGGKTLGEIAHIIAKSPDGPRGNVDIPPDSKDTYNNLILLCPTHHKVIDNNLEEWTVDKIKQAKEDHEKWVATQLDRGGIVIPSIDNTTFLKSRKKDWVDFAKEYVWITSSITPLNICEDTIDPLNPDLLELINKQSLPRDISNNPAVNQYHTRPNEYGVINEDLRNITSGEGHRLQIFRNGHCEFLICLHSSTKDISNKNNSGKASKVKMLWYSDIVNCFKLQIEGLIGIWRKNLPFNDMLLTTLLTNTESTCLYSERETRGYQPILGSKVSLHELEYNTVINKRDDVGLTYELVIRRFVNYFGLVIDTVFDQNGSMIKPRKLS